MLANYSFISRLTPIALLGVVIGALLLLPPAPASAGGGGCFQRPAEREGAGSTVSMAGGCFRPTILYVDAGTHVQFKNDSADVHQLSGVGEEQPIADKVAPSETATRTFASSGIFPYYCALHWGMTGVVVVGDATLDAPDAQLRASVAEPGAADAAPPGAAVSADDDDSLPGLALAGLGALAGVVAASALIWPVAWWRARRG